MDDYSGATSARQLLSDRMRANTAAETNKRIDEESVERVRFLAQQPAEIIDARLEALATEWDVERVLQVHGSVVALFGLFLGATISRKLLVIPLVVFGFLLNSAFQGWCPGLLLYRQLGVRTKGEIMAETNALRTLRGDFGKLDEDLSESERVGIALKGVGLV